MWEWVKQSFYWSKCGLRKAYLSTVFIVVSEICVNAGSSPKAFQVRCRGSCRATFLNFDIPSLWDLASFSSYWSSPSCSWSSQPSKRSRLHARCQGVVAHQVSEVPAPLSHRASDPANPVIAHHLLGQECALCLFILSRIWYVQLLHCTMLPLSTRML